MTTSSSPTPSPRRSFFVTRGTLSGSSLSYVPRQADRDIFASLMRGEFCCLLEAAQTGKSSLILRTAERLRSQNVTVAVLNLTAIGQNVTPEQWYYGLLMALADPLALQNELENFWLESPNLGPMQRFFAAVRHVALPRILPPALPDQWLERDGFSRLTIFIDELEALPTLPFPADEFLAGIRQCDTGREQDEIWNRLTFCLVGCSTAALCQIVQSPLFPISQRIKLEDFSPNEAKALLPGLEDAQYLLDRVLYWTSGHPYLTQRLCLAVAEIQNSNSRIQNAEVDRLIPALFSLRGVQEPDAHLLRVQSTLLESTAALATLRTLHRRERNQPRVGEREAALRVLERSGIVRVTNGEMELRNRLYAAVFNDTWIAAHRGEAAGEEPQTAHHRGVNRSLVLIVIAAIAIAAGIGFQRMQQNAWRVKAAREQTALAKSETERARNALYIARLQLAQAAYEAHNDRLLSDVLAETADSPERGPEWNYWKHITAANHPSQPEIAPLHSPDGKRFLARETINGIPMASIFEVATGRKIARLQGSPLVFEAAAFSPDGRRVVTGHSGGVVTFWDTETGEKLRAFPKHRARIQKLLFSPDARRILSLDAAGVALVWETDTGDDRFTFRSQTPDLSSQALSGGNGAGAGSNTWNGRTERTYHDYGGIGGSYGESKPRCFRLSPDGKRFLYCGKNAKGYVCDSSTGRVLFALLGHLSEITTCGWSGSGQVLATACGKAQSNGGDPTLKLWDAATGHLLFSLNPGLSRVMALAFSPDSKILYTVGRDGVARAWEVTNGHLIREFKPTGTTGKHGFFLAIAPDGRQLAVGAEAGIQLFDTAAGSEVRHFDSGGKAITALGYSPDGRLLASGDAGGTIRLRDALSGAEQAPLYGHTRNVLALAFTPDGRRLFSGADDLTVKLRETVTGQELLTLHDFPASPTALALSSAPLRLYVATRDGKFRRYDFDGTAEPK